MEEDIEVDVKEETNFLEKLDAFETTLKSLETKLEEIEKKLSEPSIEEKSEKVEEKSEEVIEETYPHPPGYPYEISEEKSKEGIALKDYISALNEVLSDILDQLNEFKTSQKSVEEIDKRLKNIENTPEFETEDEPKVKIKMASPIRICDGMVYRR